MNLYEAKQIAKSLKEMAAAQDDGEKVLVNKNKRESIAKSNMNNPVVSEDKNIKLHKIVKGKDTHYHAINHKNNECVFYSHIKQHDAGTHGLKFPHETQHAVQKYSEGYKKKGWAVAYNHFKSSDLPLVTSNLQSESAKHSWHSMAKQALKDGHHVYYKNETGKLTKINKDNLVDYVDEYHGDDDEHYKRHLVLSKKELTN